MARKLGLFIGIIWLTLGAGGPALADMNGSLSAYGRYVTEPTGQVLKEPKTASGVIAPVRSHRLVTRTDKIFGQLDRTFGLEVFLEGMPTPSVKLTIRTTHPALTNPEDGKTTSTSEYDWTVSGPGPHFFGFSFDRTWEIAEGDWTIQILYNGRVLTQKRFKVVVPIN